jgi:hypothetical protein
MTYRKPLLATLSLVALLVAVPGIAAQAATTGAAAPDAAQPAPAAPTTAAPANAAAPAEGAPVAVSSATAAEAKKITCRTERVTGSNFRTRKVCSSPNSEKASGDWVRDQQDRGAIGASAILNSAGGG